MGRYNAFLSDDINEVSSLKAFRVVTGIMWNSSQRTTKQLSSMKIGLRILFLIEWAACEGVGPGLGGLGLLGVTRGEEGVLRDEVG